MLAKRFLGYRLDPTAPTAGRLRVLILAVLVVLLVGCEPGDMLSRRSPGEPASPSEQGTRTAERPGPHPKFDLSYDELEQMTAALPERIAERILKEPAEFLEALKPVLAQPSELTRLVNKDVHLPDDYEPEDLVALDDYRHRFVLNRAGMKLSRRALDPLTEMVEAARRDGITLDLSSVYRSIEYQRGLFARYARVHGREEAERFSAEPGASEHHLGTAIDFGSIAPEFAETAAGKWLREHAWRYGFSLSYPEDKEWLTGYIYEPWHYRYIGRPATELKRRFFVGIQHHLLVFLHAHRDELEARRRVADSGDA